MATRSLLSPRIFPSVTDVEGRWRVARSSAASLPAPIPSSRGCRSDGVPAPGRLSYVRTTRGPFRSDAPPIPGNCRRVSGRRTALGLTDDSTRTITLVLSGVAHHYVPGVLRRQVTYALTCVSGVDIVHVSHLTGPGSAGTGTVRTANSEHPAS